MEADRSRARVKRAGVGSNHASAQIGCLQSLIIEVAFNELLHRPIEEEMLRLRVRAEPLFDLLLRRRLTDPEINAAFRTQLIPEPANDIVHRAPASDISRC